jgi:hypothetical protein
VVLGVVGTVSVVQAAKNSESNATVKHTIAVVFFIFAISYLLYDINS